MTKKFLGCLGIVLVILALILAFLMWSGSREKHASVETSSRSDTPSLVALDSPILMHMKGSPGETWKYLNTIRLTITASAQGLEPQTITMILGMVTKYEALSVSRFGNMDLRMTVEKILAINFLNDSPISRFDSRNPPDPSEAAETGDLVRYREAMRIVTFSTQEPTGNVTDVRFELDDGTPIEDPKTLDWMEQFAINEQLILPYKPVNRGDQWDAATQRFPMAQFGRVERTYRAKLAGFEKSSKETIAIIELDAKMSQVKDSDLTTGAELKDYDDHTTIRFSVDRGRILQVENTARVMFVSNESHGPQRNEAKIEALVELLED